MAGINYETELKDNINGMNNHVDINKGRVTTYHGIGGFMGKLSTCLESVEEEMANIKSSFNNYNDALNDVPMPLSPEEIESNLSGNLKYQYNKKIDEEVL